MTLGELFRFLARGVFEFLKASLWPLAVVACVIVLSGRVSISPKEAIEWAKIIADILKAFFWPLIVYLIVRLAAPDLPPLLRRTLEMKVGLSGLEVKLEKAMSEVEEATPEPLVASGEITGPAPGGPTTVSEAGTTSEVTAPVQIDHPEENRTGGGSYRRDLFYVYLDIVSILRDALMPLDWWTEFASDVHLIEYAGTRRVLLDPEIRALRTLYELIHHPSQGEVSPSTYLRAHQLREELRRNLPYRLQNPEVMKFFRNPSVPPSEVTKQETSPSDDGG